MTSIAAATATAATSRTTGSGSASIASDFNTFLTLLTTQLQNQSPTDPLDTNEMTAQLVQFASVEQQVNMNQNLRTLIGLEQTAQLTAAAPLIGRRVEVEADRLALQDGSATLRLPAAGTSAQARITILDGTGSVLRDTTVPLGNATQDWRWDGRDTAGRQVADGAYRVQVTGVDANGAAQTLGFTMLGKATGAERRDGNLQLLIGGVSVGFDKLRSLP